VDEARELESIPGKLYAIGPTKKTGCSLVRKNVRISGIPLSLRVPKIFEMLPGLSLISPPRDIVA